MKDPTVKLAVLNTQASATMNAAELAREDAADVQTESKMPLMVRTRKIVRLAPAIDDGFRPFRVF